MGKEGNFGINPRQSREKSLPSQKKGRESGFESGFWDESHEKWGKNGSFWGFWDAVEERGFGICPTPESVGIPELSEQLWPHPELFFGWGLTG